LTMEIIWWQFRSFKKQLNYMKIEKLAADLIKEDTQRVFGGCRMHFGPLNSNIGWYFSVEKEPTTHDEYVALLKELLACATAPDVEDKEMF